MLQNRISGLPVVDRQGMLLLCSMRLTISSRRVSSVIVGSWTLSLTNLAPSEVLGANRLLAADGTLPVLNQVPPAVREVHSARAHGTLQNLGICQEEVRRREHVKNLAGHEFNHILMLLRGATDTRGRIVPPLLIEQERLMNEIIWPFLPCFADESSVLRQRFDAGARLVSQTRPPRGD
jgi:hypothetical protein